MACTKSQISLLGSNTATGFTWRGHNYRPNRIADTVRMIPGAPSS
jgi:hypothetical protein